jgi:hypothetical protein
MKKQFLLLIIMLFAGVCFTSNKNNGLKACGTNAAACAVIKKSSMLKIPVEYTGDVEYADPSIHMFMNPFIQQ